MSADCTGAASALIWRRLIKLPEDLDRGVSNQASCFSMSKASARSLIARTSNDYYIGGKMKHAPCGKECSDCPLFGTSCDGCAKEMSMSYAYRCSAYHEAGEAGKLECTGVPCKTVDGKVCLCPLVVQKSIKSGIHLGSGPETPVE